MFFLVILTVAVMVILFVVSWKPLSYLQVSQQTHQQTLRKQRLKETQILQVLEEITQHVTLNGAQQVEVIQIHVMRAWVAQVHIHATLQDSHQTQHTTLEQKL